MAIVVLKLLKRWGVGEAEAGGSGREFKASCEREMYMIRGVKILAER